MNFAGAGPLAKHVSTSTVPKLLEEENCGLLATPVSGCCRRTRRWSYRPQAEMVSFRPQSELPVPHHAGPWGTSELQAEQNAPTYPAGRSGAGEIADQFVFNIKKKMTSSRMSPGPTSREGVRGWITPPPDWISPFGNVLFKDNTIFLSLCNVENHFIIRLSHQASFFKKAQNRPPPKKAHKK